MQAAFPIQTKLKNKTISHFQGLQLAQASQNEKWPQGKQSIKDVAIRSFVKVPEIHQPGRFCQQEASTSENPKSVVSLQLYSWAKVERVHSKRIMDIGVGTWRKALRFVESSQSFSTSLEYKRAEIIHKSFTSGALNSLQARKRLRNIQVRKHSLFLMEKKRCVRGKKPRRRDQKPWKSIT